MTEKIRDMLLAGWEDVYKKSQLTLWILLALKDGEKSMASVKDYMITRTNFTLVADDKSMYRALRRFDDADLITSKTLENAHGPDIKIWRLTETGQWVLEQFIERNIMNVLFTPQNKTLFTE